jgi:hypothetical protein
MLELIGRELPQFSNTSFKLKSYHSVIFLNYGYWSIDRQSFAAIGTD